MGIVNKFKQEFVDIKSVVNDDLPVTLDKRRDKWIDAIPYWEINIDWGGVYRVGGFITAAIAFIACWFYAVISWGFLLDVGLGWIPSLFIAIIAGFIWPLLTFVLIVGIGVVLFLL